MILTQEQVIEWLTSTNTLAEFAEKAYQAGAGDALEKLRGGGVELPKPLGYNFTYTKDQAIDYGDRRAAALQAQVELLCAEIKKADKLLSDGNSTEALSAVRHMAMLASKSYLKRVGRAAAAVPPGYVVVTESEVHDAKRWQLLDTYGDISAFIREFHSGLCLSTSDIDAAMLEAAKE